MDMAQRVVSSDGHDLDLLENQAPLCCLLFSVLPLLEVEILVLRKEEGARRTECRTEGKFSPGIFSTDTVFYVEPPIFSFQFLVRFLKAFPFYAALVNCLTSHQS